MVAEFVQAEEVGRARFGSGAGDEGDDFALVDVAVLFEQSLGQLDHGLRWSAPWRSGWG